MEQVHLMEWPSTQVFSWTSPAVAMNDGGLSLIFTRPLPAVVWSKQSCTPQISWGPDHVNCAMWRLRIRNTFYYTALVSSYSLGWNIPTQPWFYLLDSAAKQAYLLHHMETSNTHAPVCPFIATTDIGNFSFIFHFSHVMAIAICSSFCTLFHHLVNHCY